MCVTGLCLNVPWHQSLPYDLQVVILNQTVECQQCDMQLSYVGGFTLMSFWHRLALAMEVAPRPSKACRPYVCYCAFS